MPSVFLSYASQDEAYAKSLEEGLSEQGITVWRDKTSLHTGERWPKRLGEAIAEQEFFLLLWSQSSSKSDFVELEWTTAIALKKTVLLLLVDSTKLPASLEAIHGISPTQPTQAIQQLLTALQQPHAEKDQERSKAVIDQLAEISSVQPKAVLEQAKAVFQQSNWSVQGNVYQAGGDIHVNVTSEKTQKTGSPGLDKSIKWVGLGVAILTLVGLLLDVPAKIMKLVSLPTTVPSVRTDEKDVPSVPEKDPAERLPKVSDTPTDAKVPTTEKRPKKVEKVAPAKSPKPTLAKLSGLVSDKLTGEPLKGATVTVPSLQLSSSTDEQGYFNLQVNSRTVDRVLMIVQMKDYKTFKTKATVGNTNLGIALRRLP